MGTSLSASRNKNCSLPEELVIEILSYLSLNDLVSCRLIDRELNDIINGSQHLQHQIDTAVAGVVDNPDSTLSLLARRSALARRQVAWDTCQPQNTTSFERPSQDFLKSEVAPKHERNETLLRLNNLREKGEYKIVSLAVCNNNDLIAMGSVSPLINSAGFHDSNQSDQHSFEVDLLSVSCGGGEHPAARKSTLRIKNISRSYWKEIQMKIHTNLLAVHLMYYDPHSGLFPSELWILDWKNGEKLAVGTTGPAGEAIFDLCALVLEG